MRVDHEDMDLDGNSAATIDFECEELAVELETGKQLETITPFIGARYSDYKEERKLRQLDAGSDLDYEAKNPWSAFVGVDVKLNKNWKLGVNIRYDGHESACSVGVNKRF